MTSLLDRDWTSILPLNGSKQDAFEELCTQIARASCPPNTEFVRKGRPDSGVEAFALLPDGAEWVWQAKYFDGMHSSQWSQLDGSVEAALAGHPKLKRFIACVSLDLPDGRTPGTKSAQQHWMDRVHKWTEWATQKGMTVEFVWQGSHELLGELAKPGNEGLDKFFFGGRSLDEGWFAARMSDAISAAGPRYTPELNVALGIQENFQALGRTRAFFDTIRSHAISIRNRIRRHAFSLMKDADGMLLRRTEAAQEACEKALLHFRCISEDPIEVDPLGGLANALHDAIQEVRALLNDYRRQQEEAESAREGAGNRSRNARGTYRSADDTTHTLRELHSDLIAAAEHVAQWSPFVNSKLLVLSGDAGTGKTHLLCDLARDRLARKQPTVVLMGQRFLSNAEPWTQALQQLDLGSWTSAELIHALEVVAQRANTRVFFIVDAINEGAGRQIWPIHLAPFLSRLQASPWISVIVSVRSSYAEDLLPEGGFANSVSLTHVGFENIEFDATRAFFEHYGIDLPSSPLLAPEFSNPLYLKTLCQGMQAAGQTRLSRSFHGIVEAFQQYLAGVNKKLARELDYRPQQGLVRIALRDIAARMVEQQEPWLDYEEAAAITDAHLPNRDFSRSLSGALFREGLLIEERVWSDVRSSLVTVVQIAYERMSDYLCVEQMLDSHLPADTDPSLAFENGGPLDHRVLCRTWLRPGFHEALHILVAERTGRELLDLMPALEAEHFTPEMFLSSVQWRAPNAVTQRTKFHLHRMMRSTPEAVIDTLVTLATVPDHPLNIVFTDALLRTYSMADRDAWWSIGLHGLWDSKSAVDRLVYWARRLNAEVTLSQEAAVLAARTLAWLLTSSNRYLRDRTTKGLVRVLTWQPIAISGLIDDFADLDDAYVAERVLAAVYGAVMRAGNADGIGAVADRIHTKIFAEGRPRPHLLLRDYAWGVISRAKYLQLDNTPSRWPNSEPPYISDWPAIPSEDELDRIVPSWTTDAGRSVSPSQHRIRSSVMTDDFGRYVIGTNSGRTNWLSLRLTEPLWMSLERRITHATQTLTTKERKAWELLRRAARQAGAEGLDRLLAQIHAEATYTSSDDSGEAASHLPASALFDDVRELFLTEVGAERAALFAPLIDELIDKPAARH